MNQGEDSEALECKMEYILPDPIIDKLEAQVIIPNTHLNPTLGVIIREDDSEDSFSYLRSIQGKAKKYNANVDVRTVKNAAIAADAITELKSNPGVYGIMNLSHFGGADRALNDMIPPRLDIDCASSYTLGSFLANTSNIGFRLAPCTAIACYKMIEHYYNDGDFSNTNVAILGRSIRVGRPLAEILCQKNATVTVMHSKSNIHKQELYYYDIVVSAMGAPEEIRYSDLVYSQFYDSGEIVHHPKVVLDVGMGLKNGQICGDVQKEIFSNIANVKITPTFGGIGKLTTVILFTKLFTNAAKVMGASL